MGNFKCSYKDHHLNTDSTQKMREHFAKEAHRFVGNIACFNCGNVFKVDKDLKVAADLPAPRLLCGECAAA